MFDVNLSGVGVVSFLAIVAFDALVRLEAVYLNRPPLDTIIPGEGRRSERDVRNDWKSDIISEGFIVTASYSDPLTLNREKRAATNQKDKLWPNATVPYVFGNITEDVRRNVMAAMLHWQQHTCIRFVSRTPSQQDYIVFVTGNCGCCSLVGRRGGSQEVTLSAHCATYGVAVHELGHVVGFWHEHSRSDRDLHIDVMRENIASEKLDNFDKKTATDTSSLGEPYDYQSIMHYSSNTFSKNGKDTLVPRQPGVKIGQRRALSAGDITQTRLLYRCPKPRHVVELKSSEQSFESPNYPDNYYKDYECTWVITAMPGEEITLHLMDFSLEKSDNCTFDYVELREGPAAAVGQMTGDRLVGRLCGDGVPGTFRTVGNSLWIKFVSDASVTSRGFWALYFKRTVSDESDDSSSGAVNDGEDVDSNPEYARGLIDDTPTVYIANCNRYYENAIGTVSSPLMPIDYTGRPVECLWTVDGGRNASRIVLNIETPRPDIHQQHCLGHVYQVINTAVAGLSRYHSPLTAASHRRHQYHQHRHVQQQQQQWQTPDQSNIIAKSIRARRHAEVDDGTDRYSPLRYDCLSTNSLLIPSNRVVIHWSSYYRQPITFSYTIDYDECWLGTARCDHKCDNTLTGFRCSCDLGFILHADGRTCMPKKPDKSDVCPYGRPLEMTLDRGDIIVNLGSKTLSPVTSSGGTAQQYDCQWHIRPPDDETSVMLRFVSFHVQASAGPLMLSSSSNVKQTACADSFVEARIGKNLTVPGTRHCGAKLPSPITAPPGDSIVLRLKATVARGIRVLSKIRLPQFSAQYVMYKTTSECEHKVRVPPPGVAGGIVEITSPEYPKPYPSHAMCTWRVSARRRSDRLRLNLVDVDIEKTVDCRFDFLEVRITGRKGSASSVIGHYCGTHDGVNVSLPLDSHVIVVFMSDSTGESRGFRAVFTTEKAPQSGRNNVTSAAISTITSLSNEAMSKSNVAAKSTAKKGAKINGGIQPNNLPSTTTASTMIASSTSMTTSTPKYLTIIDPPKGVIRPYITRPLAGDTGDVTRSSPIARLPPQTTSMKPKIRDKLKQIRDKRQ